MSKLDTIIAVKEVQKSAKWYTTVFECENIHGGDSFAILVLENGEVFLCLHEWGTHEHPTMIEATNSIGNGLILYFRTANINSIRENLKKMNYSIEEEIHVNENTLKQEFSFRDPDGYFIIVSEFHKYEG